MRCPYTRAGIDCDKDDDGNQSFHCRRCGETFDHPSEPAERCPQEDEEPDDE